MHYRNGRAAKQGDKVIELKSGKSGIIHSINPGTTCNALMAPIQAGEWVTLSDCIHMDDIAAHFPEQKKAR